LAWGVNVLKVVTPSQLPLEEWRMRTFGRFGGANGKAQWVKKV